MKPTFVSQDAPVSCRVDERLQPWEEKPEGGGRDLRSQSSKFPLKQEEDEDDREKALTLSGKRKRGGKETVSVDIWLRKWKQASICLQNLHFSSTKFSFQSPDHKRRVSACVRVCVYVGVFSTNRSTEINVSTNASQRASFCASLAASLGTHCSGCLAQGHNFRTETCLLVCWIFIKSCLSACRRSTDNNLGTFFILYLNLDLFV